MGLFDISKKLHLEVYNHDEPHGSSLRKPNKERILLKRGKEVGRATANKEFIGGIESSKQNDFSLAKL